MNDNNHKAPRSLDLLDRLIVNSIEYNQAARLNSNKKVNDPTKLGTINAIQLSDFKDLSNNISNNNNNSNKISNYNNSNNNVGYNSSNYNNSDNSNQNSYSNYRGRGRGSYRGYRGRGRGGYRGGRGRGRGGYRGGRGRGRRTSYRSGRRTRVKMPYYAKNTCDKCNIWGHWESQCEWITKDHPQLNTTG